MPRTGERLLDTVERETQPLMVPKDVRYVQRILKKHRPIISALISSKGFLLFENNFVHQKKMAQNIVTSFL